jgi:hypothetical protein
MDLYQRHFIYTHIGGLKMKKISKKQVTASLDRIADLFQNHAEQLGVPSRVAFDFAYRCDLLSDALDKMASEDKKEEKEEEKRRGRKV